MVGGVAAVGSSGDHRSDVGPDRTGTTRPVLSAITEGDVPDVAGFLHEHLNPGVPAAVWATAVRTPWEPAGPDHGRVLRVDGAVVGVALAFWSQRTLRGGQTVRVCNLGAWCVLPAHRFAGIRLLKDLLAVEDVVFTDMSPSGAVVPLNRRLGFTDLDTATWVVPNLPVGRPTRVRAVSRPDRVESLLSGEQLALYQDHRGLLAAHHVVLVRGSRTCYVVVRRDRRKGLPLFASVLHASDPELLRDGWHVLARHLLLHLRVPLTLVEPRVTGHRPALSRRVSAPRPKMFRGDVDPSEVDALYSELVCVPW